MHFRERVGELAPPSRRAMRLLNGGGLIRYSFFCASGGMTGSFGLALFLLPFPLYGLLGESRSPTHTLSFSGLFSCSTISSACSFASNNLNSLERLPTSGKRLASIDEDRFLKEVRSSVMFFHPYTAEQNVEWCRFVV